MVIPKTYGRMGNFLFQVAAAMGYAWRHNLEFSIPSSTRDKASNPIYLQHLVNPKWDPRTPAHQIREHTHGYQELPFKEHWRTRNIVLDGYWQSEKYFLEFRDRVLEAFHYPWQHVPGTVSVHVRRTDYIRLTQKHPPVGKEWYDMCMSQFPGAEFRFFSDDIRWCRMNWGMREDCKFSEGRTEEQDLVSITCCEHHISSASTFSWWGAWLNRNTQKRIIIPKNWFQPGYRKTDTKDIVPESWEKV